MSFMRSVASSPPGSEVLLDHLSSALLTEVYEDDLLPRERRLHFPRERDREDRDPDLDRELARLRDLV